MNEPLKRFGPFGPLLPEPGPPAGVPVDERPRPNLLTRLLLWIGRSGDGD
jgi:hypothetical protein